MKDKHELDQLFKTGLSDPDIPFNEKHWEDMLGKLDAEKKKRIVPMWLYMASGIAAALLLVLFWVFSGPTGPEDKNKGLQVKVKPVEEVKKTDGDIGGDLRPEDQLTVIDKGVSTVKLVQGKEGVKDDLLIASNGIDPTRSDLPGLTDEVFVDPVIQEDLAPFTASKGEHHKEGIKDVDVIKPTPLVLSIIAAPDVTRGASSRPAKLSSNIGLLATYAITRKLSVTSGLIYARKFYNYGGLAPAGSTYAGNAWEVDADCRVLDIPLNVNYQVYKRNRFSVSLNSGLSSYLMLNEKYKYINGPQGDQKISVREIKNENQHFFGVANLSVSFEQKINRSLSIGVQPFAKLPLTGIGYGDANLKSTGVSFSLNFGLK